ncbi:MAG TPA: PAS domain S-box protein [Capillimicrobium sp.]|nr:PAS domain S-box protein [Capillimicrobium sp.]
MRRTDARMSEESQLALLVSQAADYAIFLMDPSGCIRAWNPGAERMQGYRRDEIVGQHFSVFYTEEDRARDHPAEELRIATETGRYEEEGWRVRKDGSRFWANIVITALRDEDGELIGFGKVSRDLTVRRLAEEQTKAKALELEAANRELAEYRRLVLSVRDYAIFMLDPSGHILSWNAGAQHLKGYTPEEIIGRHFSVFYTAADRARDHPAHELEIAIREGRYEEEGWRIRKDGSRFWASVTITAVRDEQGRLKGFAKVTRDLTERKRDEEALLKAVEQLQAANEELDRFASIAAHDMTDPLRTISGFAELLVQSDVTAEEGRHYAQHILDSSLRLTTMLQALLAYARAGRTGGEIEPVDLVEVVAQVQDDLAATIADRNARVDVDIPAGAAALIQTNDLRVILQNLISNAVKFGDKDAPVVTIDAEHDGDDWCISVTDNGGGIAPEHQERIFTAFERAGGTAGGYGLGLAICQRLVERHGGRIGVDSAPDRPTRFWFTVRASDHEPAVATESELAERA